MKRPIFKNKSGQFIGFISKIKIFFFYLNNKMFLCLSDAKQPTASLEFNKAYKKSETVDCLWK